MAFQRIIDLPDKTAEATDNIVITAGTTYGSQTLGGTTKDAGETATGNTVQVQLSNSTGSAIKASVTIVGRIKGA